MRKIPPRWIESFSEHPKITNIWKVIPTPQSLLRLKHDRLLLLVHIFWTCYQIWVGLIFSKSSCQPSDFQLIRMFCCRGIITCLNLMRHHLRCYVFPISCILFMKFAIMKTIDNEIPVRKLVLTKGQKHFRWCCVALKSHILVGNSQWDLIWKMTIEKWPGLFQVKTFEAYIYYKITLWVTDVSETCQVFTNVKCQHSFFVTVKLFKVWQISSEAAKYCKVRGWEVTDGSSALQRVSQICPRIVAPN